MKILIDTSTLYSAIAFDGKIKEIVDLLIEKHTIVISDYIAIELRMNIEAKVSEDIRQEALQRIDDLIASSLIKKKEEYIKFLPEAMKLVSKKDSPILACAMLPEIDVLVTSDKEFWNLDCDEVLILSPAKAKKKLL